MTPTSTIPPPPSSSSSIAYDHKGIDLPEWIFDVTEQDDDNSDSDPTTTTTNQQQEKKTLLQELEIDPHHIARNIVWMFLGPCIRFAGRHYKRHPLYIATSNRQRIDFWGPCSVVILYSLLVWCGRSKDVVWIFAIWAIASLFSHLISRAFFHSTWLLHVALLGYCVTPMIPFAALLLLFTPPLWLSWLLQMVAVGWSTWSAILSYSTVIILPSEHKKRLRLLFPVILLMTLYLTSFLPSRLR